MLQRIEIPISNVKNNSLAGDQEPLRQRLGRHVLGAVGGRGEGVGRVGLAIDDDGGDNLVRRRRNELIPPAVGCKFFYT